MNTPSKPLLTLDQHLSVYYRQGSPEEPTKSINLSIHMSDLTYGRLLTDYWSSVYRVSTEYWSGCGLSVDWDVDQGYHLRVLIDTRLGIPLVHMIWRIYPCKAFFIFWHELKTESHCNHNETPSVADLGNTRSVIVSDQLCQNTNQNQSSVQVSILQGLTWCLCRVY